jgi:hypothetical protein
MDHVVNLIQSIRHVHVALSLNGKRRIARPINEPLQSINCVIYRMIYAS